MNQQHCKTIAEELNVTLHQVEATALLLIDGATVPFIARYRREKTGGLDEQVITKIRDRIEELEQLEDRRKAILKSLQDRNLLTDELEHSLKGALTSVELEDLYLPYRPKRRTRATVARERGLEPLAELIYSQQDHDVTLAARAYVDDEKQVSSTEDALSGARDIIAEWITEDLNVRTAAREQFFRNGVIKSTLIAGKELEGAKYRDYFDYLEDVRNSPGHRILAVFRGEKEGILSVAIRPEDPSLVYLHRIVVKNRTSSAYQVNLALEDAYKRLLAPSIETEVRHELKRRADDEAISVFSNNLRELLLAPPLGRKRIMALDPGFRTGAKLVCLDDQGNLIHNDTVYVTQSKEQAERAAETIKKICNVHAVEAVAIGNGTAGRETESFIRNLHLGIPVIMVNESGASIYSASEVAREEFPDYDITVRGSVSIGRRLMDPLSELVKIDPKSIGVGQYQHDVDQNALKKSLDDVVVSCVNNVGVELNMAGKELLSYVSGLGPSLARNIVRFRKENGPFRRRQDLLKVPRLGPKAYEQAAGFLRIPDSDNPLDGSAVHPESYYVVEAFARDLNCSVTDLVSSPELRNKIDVRNYVNEKVGLPTLIDIMAELAKPGRDPRPEFEFFNFDERINSIDDLREGMVLPGIVTNVTKFGAFVDIGVHQDGLVHISKIADKFVKDPSDVVKPQQKVKVTVLEVDKERKRISLSMRSN